MDAVRLQAPLRVIATSADIGLGNIGLEVLAGAPLGIADVEAHLGVRPDTLDVALRGVPLGIAGEWGAALRGALLGIAGEWGAAQVLQGGDATAHAALHEGDSKVDGRVQG